MEITILNGNPNEKNETFDDYLARLSTALVSSGHNVTDFELRDMDISYCIGCLKCWVQTPTAEFLIGVERQFNGIAIVSLIENADFEICVGRGCHQLRTKSLYVSLFVDKLD